MTMSRRSAMGVRPRRARRGGQGGQVVVVFALVFTVMVGFAGLVTDTSGAYDRTRRDQNIADAAALAGSYGIYNNELADDFSGAQTAVNAMAAQDACTSPCTVTAITYLQSDGVTVATSPATTDRVKVDITDRYTPFLIQVLSHSPTITIKVTATAQVLHGLGLQQGFPVPCQLCMMSTTATNCNGNPNPGQCGLNLQATNVTVATSAGDFDVNGSAAVAGSGDIITLTGGYKFKIKSTLDTQHSPSISPAPLCSNSSGGVSCNGTWTKGPIGDPLSAIPTPTMARLAVQPDPAFSGGTVNVQPGIYGTWNLSGTGTTVNMAPGTYVFAGGAGSGIQASGAQTTLNGTDVTIYFTCGTPAAPTACASGAQGANFTFTGNNSSLYINAPTSSTYMNLLMFYDRNNTSQMVLGGGNNMDVNSSGALYALKSDALITGNSNASGSVIAWGTAPIIVNTLTASGNNLTIGGATHVGQQPNPGDLIQ
jgi:Flp pilus assembly protein TadG